MTIHCQARGRPKTKLRLLPRRPASLTIDRAASRPPRRNWREALRFDNRLSDLRAAKKKYEGVFRSDNRLSDLRPAKKKYEAPPRGPAGLTIDCQT